ncbi:MAG: sulfotransferase, partial [Chthoniobacteraceae bacterium]
MFIVGLYRSGTTLLYALLNQHPQISLMYEVDALAIPCVEPSAARSPRWLLRNELWNRVLTRHGIDPSEVRQSKDARGLYQAFAGRNGAIYCGEKAPAYARWLGKVARTFPEAHFVIILRELPEVYQSVRDAGKRGSRFFGRKGQLPRTLWSQRVLMRDVRRLEARSIPVFFLRYRELVTDAAAVSHRVCDFLELEFTAKMASLQSAD